MATTYDGVEIRFLTDEEWWQMFDRQAHELLEMSGEEFIERWNAGEFIGDDRSQVVHVFMLSPLPDTPPAR